MQNKIINSDITNIVDMGFYNLIENCMFVGDNIKIGNHCTIKNSIIKSGTSITDSYIEDAIIGSECSIGPYSRIRPKTQIGNNCKIGNFVEIKNSKIGDNSKASHLSYIGDAIVGKNVNIGCGVVFCNYNGCEKNISIVGNNCFLGSNANIIAPVKIEDDTYICAGTTVTKSTQKGDFVVGRARDEAKPNYSYYLKNKCNK